MFDPQLLAPIVIIPLGLLIAAYGYMLGALALLTAATLLFYAVLIFFHIGSILAIPAYILISALKFYKPSTKLKRYIPYLLTIFLIDLFITMIGFDFNYVDKANFMGILEIPYPYVE